MHDNNHEKHKRSQSSTRAATRVIIISNSIFLGKDHVLSGKYHQSWNMSLTVHICLAETTPYIIRDNGLTECHSNTTGLVENLPEAALVSGLVKNSIQEDSF